MTFMTSRSRFITLYLFFLREFYRSRAFAVMFMLIGLVASAVTAMTLLEYSTVVTFIVPGPSNLNHISPGLRSLFLNYIWSYIGVLIPPLAASFYASPAVSGDFESGTIIPLFTLPVTKDKILFSKMLASFTAITVTMTLFELFQLVAVGLSGPAFPLSTFLLSFALMVVFIFSCNSMAFAVGVYFNKGTQSTIVYLMLFYVVFNVLSIIFLLGSNTVPLYILNNSGGIVNRVFADLNPVAFFYGGAISGAQTSEILYCVEVMLLYSVFFILLSYYAFTRKRGKI